MSLSLIPAAPEIRCDAGRLLNDAEVSLGYGCYIEAGCYLRAGVKEMLEALCRYYGVGLSRHKARRTAGTMINGLVLHGHLRRDLADDILESINVGNRAAHCCFVLPADIEDAIRGVRWFYDQLPFAGRKGGAV